MELNLFPLCIMVVKKQVYNPIYNLGSFPKAILHPLGLLRLLNWPFLGQEALRALLVVTPAKGRDSMFPLPLFWL